MIQAGSISSIINLRDYYGPNVQTFINDGFSYVMSDGAANADGIINTITLVYTGPLNNLKVGTFKRTYNNFFLKRDSAVLGSAPNLSNLVVHSMGNYPDVIYSIQTWTGLSIKVRKGDFLGVRADKNSLGTTGFALNLGSGYYYKTAYDNWDIFTNSLPGYLNSSTYSSLPDVSEGISLSLVSNQFIAYFSLAIFATGQEQLVLQPALYNVTIPFNTLGANVVGFDIDCDAIGTSTPVRDTYNMNYLFQGTTPWKSVTDGANSVIGSIDLGSNRYLPGWPYGTIVHDAIPEGQYDIKLIPIVDYYTRIPKIYRANVETKTYRKTVTPISGYGSGEKFLYGYFIQTYKPSVAHYINRIWIKIGFQYSGSGYPDSGSIAILVGKFTTWGGVEQTAITGMASTDIIADGTTRWYPFDLPKALLVDPAYTYGIEIVAPGNTYLTKILKFSFVTGVFASNWAGGLLYTWNGTSFVQTSPGGYDTMNVRIDGYG